MIAPFMHRQIARLTPEDFHYLVSNRRVIVMPPGETPNDGTSTFRDEQSLTGVQSLLHGSALVLLDTTELTPGLGQEEADILAQGSGGVPAMVGWRGQYSLSIMMHKAEVLQMKEKMAKIVQLRFEKGIGPGPVQRIASGAKKGCTDVENGDEKQQLQEAGDKC